MSAESLQLLLHFVKRSFCERDALLEIIFYAPFLFCSCYLNTEVIHPLILQFLYNTFLHFYVLTHFHISNFFQNTIARNSTRTQETALISITCFRDYFMILPIAYNWIGIRSTYLWPGSYTVFCIISIPVFHFIQK